MRLIYSIIFLLAERLISYGILILPQIGIDWFYRRSVEICHMFAFFPLDDFAKHLQAAEDFEAMCALFNYEVEEHIVQTKDGFLLVLHRIKGNLQIHTSSNLPVVYFHHGLMMNSEIFVCQLNKAHSLAFHLVDLGYDCWFGNNRGNKYSRKHKFFDACDEKFWNYSMDHYALYDIPDTIEYIVQTAKVNNLTYVGFSQGSAQAFAALSTHQHLNNYVNLFIALAPAMSPRGLSNTIVDNLVKSSPRMLYMLFGRKALLSSTVIWQAILYPPIFVKIIDYSLVFLFNWRTQNVSLGQKIVSYAHLYSHTSVKSLVHWFQIIRAKRFQFYDDQLSSFNIFNKQFYRAARFPTRNIKSPVVLIYGGSDSLVDINIMISQLPGTTIIHKIPNYEHLDLLWGRDVGKNVIPLVMSYIKDYFAAKKKRKF